MTKIPSQPEIVTFAVFLLGGDKKFIDTEDIAKRAYALSPGRFSWRKYPDQINLELVRVFLSDAKKEKNGSLLEGSGKKGWTLTPDGLKWIRGNQEQIQALLETSDQQFETRAGSVDSKRADREIGRIRGTVAWEKWNHNDDSISPLEAKEIFRIDSYANCELAQLKIDRLLKLTIANDEIEAFLRDMGSVVMENIFNE